MFNRFLFIALCSTLAMVFTSDAHAQRRTPTRYNTPTISPYTQLFNQNNGGVNNYLNFVRPQLQFQQQLNNMQQQGGAFPNQQVQNRYVQQQNQNIQQAIQNTLLQALPRQGTTARRATAASFMNTNPFYPPFAIQPGSGAGRRNVGLQR